MAQRRGQKRPPALTAPTLTKAPSGGKIRVAILLDDAPGADESGSRRQRRRQEQEEIAARIAQRIGRPLEVVWNFTRSTSVIAANVYREDVALIEAVEGVVSVTPETEHELHGDRPTAADKPRRETE